MLSTNAQPTLSDDEVRARIAAVPFWFHQIEVAPGIITPGFDRSADKLQQMGLPEDLSGKRVLDIGAADGFFTFECERRGAEVVAIDGNPATGFGVARELLGLNARFVNLDIYDLAPEVLGQFDLVLCLGVLYHLRHPLLGLERVRSVCRGRLILETQVCDHYFIDTSGTPHHLEHFAPQLLSIPIAQFYPGTELNGDPTNWWAPNVAALHGMLRSFGFEPYQTISYGTRAYVHCLSTAASIAEEWGNTVAIGNPRVQELRAGTSGESGATNVHLDAVSTRQAQSPWQTAPNEFVETLQMQSQQVLQLQQALAERDAHLADLEARARWLDEQSREARRALAAVENGQVMRILRWLTGSR